MHYTKAITARTLILTAKKQAAAIAQSSKLGFDAVREAANTAARSLPNVGINVNSLLFVLSFVGLVRPFSAFAVDTCLYSCESLCAGNPSAKQCEESCFVDQEKRCGAARPDPTPPDTTPFKWKLPADAVIMPNPLFSHQLCFRKVEARLEERYATGTCTLPDAGYVYCTHKIRIKSQRPRDDRLITVTQLPNGVRVEALVPHVGVVEIGGQKISFDGNNWIDYEVLVVGVREDAPRPTTPVPVAQYEENWGHPPWTREPWARYCHFPPEDVQVGRQKTSGRAVTLPVQKCGSTGSLHARSAIGQGPNRSVACANASSNALIPPMGLAYACSNPCECSGDSDGFTCTVSVWYRD